MNRDLTVGKPTGLLWKFCLPLFGSVIFQQLYNLADSFVAGNFIGENALAAVGNSYEITLVFLAFSFGFNIGCSIIVSRFFGAKDYKSLKTSIFTTFIVGGALCALLMTVGIIFCEPLLRLINTPENIFADSKTYLDIYIYSLPFVFFYNISTGIFSALGDSRTPFIFLVASSLTNIGMDILFVAAFDMGVAGVAWATLICQGISCVLALVFVFLRFRELPTKGKVKPFSLSIFRLLLSVILPSVAQQGCVSVGNIIIQSIINPFGANVIAGYAAAIKLNNLVTSSMLAVANGISNYASQNLGARKVSRIKDGVRSGIGIVWSLCVPIFVAYFFFGEYLVRFFLNSPSATALGVGVTFLKIVSPFYFVIALKLIPEGTLRGVGRMGPFLITTFTDLAMRVIIAMILAPKYGDVGIWSAWPVSWIVAAGMALVFYKLTDFEKIRRKISGEEMIWNHNSAYYGWILKITSSCNSILDVGCGDGVLTAMLADAGKDACGIDSFAPCIENAKSRYKNAGFICGDFEKYVFEKKFDALVFVASLHHMDMERALARAEDCLCDGGKLVIVGISKPESASDYILEALRVMPSKIISGVNHMKRRSDDDAPEKESDVTIREVRRAISKHFVNVRISYGLHYRYLLVCEKEKSEKE